MLLPLLQNLNMLGPITPTPPINTMAYAISTARKILYDEITANMPTVAIYDAIAEDDAQPPFLVFDGFTATRVSKCGFDVVCRVSIYDQFNQRGGNLRSDQLGEQLLTICEGVGCDVTISTQGVRTFNRANYRQQFEVTIKDI